MKKALSHIGSLVDHIPESRLVKKDLKILVSEYLWDCILYELKDYKANKDQDNENNEVESFFFDGIKIESSSKLKGYNVHIFDGTSSENKTK